MCALMLPLLLSLLLPLVLLPGVLLLCISIGLLMGKSWARSFMIGISALLPIGDIFGTILVSLAPGGAPGGIISHIVYWLVPVPCPDWIEELLGGLVGNILDVLIPSILALSLIYYLRKPAVKAFFGQNACAH